MCHFGLWVLLLVVIVSISGARSQFSSLDLNDIENSQYDIHIGGLPLLDTALGPEASLGIPMVNKFGQKYHCKLPKDETQGDEEDETKAAKKIVHGPANIPELLAPMMNEPCIVKTKDWWTYEVCYQKVAKQYHVEDGRPSGKIMILGYYDHDLEWPANKAETEENPDADLMQLTLRHHKQFYTNGSKCDLNGEMRKTEVRYECDPLSVVDYISRVDEPQSCEYVIVVKTAKICSIPQLKPPPTRKPKPIECQPILNNQEFQKYEKYKLAQEKYAEKKRHAHTLFQKDQMLKLLDGEDLTGINVDTEEGLAQLESRVGNKMAEKLVSELGVFFDKSVPFGTHKIRRYTSFDDLFNSPKDDEESNDVDNLLLPNGEQQSRIRQSKDDNWFTLSNKKYRLSKMDLGFDKRQNIDKNLVDDEKLETSSKINLDPRSDLSDEDEMVDVLVDTLKKMSNSDRDLKMLKDELKLIRETLADSIDDILDETENEMNLKLDGLERHNAIDQLSETLNDLMDKLDATGADIARVSSEIEKVQGVIETQEEMLQNTKDSLQNENSEEEQNSKAERAKVKTDDDKDDDKKKINVKITNLSATQLKQNQDSDTSEERVIKHLEAAIKDKLERSGLDTGGRQIEVKLITSTGYPVDLGEDFEDPVGTGAQGDEARQVQHMLYNLMVGDHAGYKDIDSQRKSERNYKFTYDTSGFSVEEDPELDSGSTPKAEKEEIREEIQIEQDGDSENLQTSSDDS